MIQILKGIGYILGLTEADQAFNWDCTKKTGRNLIGSDMDSLNFYDTFGKLKHLRTLLDGPMFV